MESRGPKKPRRHKKRKIKTLERLLKKFPYRLGWLTEPDQEPLQSWKTKSNSVKDQLPLQKKLVPTRSIPPPGVGTSDFTSQPPRPPLCNHWELKLLNHRFPRRDLDKLPSPKASADKPYTSEASGPSESVV
ncbi:uncharacterized protein C3orf22 homolog [Mesocricetus auratus]|uniref:Uncharacterized protein C3orf22 homolog n=1 Tax=Mesocricetus auratus TaxID=10036 RepID=A0A1U7QNI3_MESAU|nr:uncharacterized protein C3orf22 homolog [Mesocricetus auratus]XP_040594914.1 uncharacterized protein C3orf22 homolog [Mesocricetus auratus]XP_040594915.1 uncharacterized protein C3orf22 homolog [Mesocricetus auratus]